MVFDCRLSTSRRIINGLDAPQDFMPWFAVIAVVAGQNSLSASCGGFILNNQYVVTAAHCTQQAASTYKVLLNVNSLTNLASLPVNYRFDVDLIYNHPYFNSRNLGLGHDISLLKLRNPIVFQQNKIEQACIRFLNRRMDNILVAGIGSVTRFEIRNGQRTRGTYPDRIKYTTLQETTPRTQRVIYARGKSRNSNICTGDSGSPAHTFLSGKVAVVGVASFGQAQRTSRRNVFIMCNGLGMKIFHILIYKILTVFMIIIILLSTCNNLAGFTRLSYEKPFLDKYANGNYCTL